MNCMPSVVLGSIQRSMEYEPEQILTWCSDYWCLGEIRHYQCPSLPVWSNLSVNLVNLNKTYMSNMNFVCELTIGIPRLPSLCSMAKAVSFAFGLVYSVTSDSVNLDNFAICSVASKCFPIEPVPCSDGWRRTWWQMIHIMPGLPDSSIPQSK